MKASDSVTSLSALQVCDTACHFCNEEASPEEGDVLVDSKSFLSCACRFAVHKDCWNEYLDTLGSSRPMCPVCKQVIAPFRGQIIAAAAKDVKDQRKIMTLIGVVFIAVVLVVGLIVWGMFSH